MIKIQNLVKQFGAKRAVDDLTFSVEKGEVLGFLGPNGAGKSTTMRMITGFIPATSGKISVGNHDIEAEPMAAKELMGYLPENAPCYPDMTVNGFLGFAAEMRGLTGGAKKRAINRAAEMCFLENVMHQSVETLSKGYRHRTCFAQSVIHDPEVLILDEPTDGLDPNQKHEVRTLIRKMGETKAIIFSTHILEEVDAVCSRALIIDRGHIVANGTPAELRSKSQNAGAVTLQLRDVSTALLNQRLNSIGLIERVDVVKNEAPVLKVRILPKKVSTTAAVTTDLAQQVSEALVGCHIVELHTEEGRLDEVFRNITMQETAKAVGA